MCPTKWFSVIQEVITANVVRAQGEGQHDSMSSEVTGHPGPTGEQTLASEVVPTLWEVAAVIAKLQSGSGSIYRLQLSRMENLKSSSHLIILSSRCPTQVITFCLCAQHIP